MNSGVPWYLWSSLEYKRERKIIVVGAGFAGCYLSRELAELGWKVELFDEANSVGSRASANPQALLFPVSIDHDKDLASLILKEGFQYSQQILPKWIKDISSCWTGVFSNYTQAYYKSAGWVNLPQFCNELVKHKNINIYLNSKLTELNRDDDYWWVNSVSAPVLVLTTGLGTLSIKECSKLYLQPVKGQVTWVKSTEKLNLLKYAICGKGHVLPEYGGQNLIGASFERGQVTRNTTIESDLSNLNKLFNLMGESLHTDSIARNWADVRTMTHDHIPCVGPIINQYRFYQHYSRLAKDKNLAIPPLNKAQNGLYVFTGFGSKGLTTIPWLAYNFAKQLDGKVDILSSTLIKALSPSRFMVRDIIKNRS